MKAQEIFYIFLIALVVLGPQRLPIVARKLGNWAAEFRKAAGELRSGLEAEVGDLAEIKREVITPLQDAKKDLQAPLRELRRDVGKPIAEMKSAADAITSGIAATAKLPPTAASKPLRWVGPVPESGPTADDAAEDLKRIDEGKNPGKDLSPETDESQESGSAPGAGDQAEASA